MIVYRKASQVPVYSYDLKISRETGYMNLKLRRDKKGRCWSTFTQSCVVVMIFSCPTISVKRLLHSLAKSVISFFFASRVV